MRVKYTPEEIAEMHDRNENFNGVRANFEKIKLYHDIRDGLVDFMGTCQDVRQLDGYAPNPKEKHAMLWMDFSPAAILNESETKMLASIMGMADGVVLSAVDGCVRISFDVNNIWEK